MEAGAAEVEASRHALRKRHLRGAELIDHVDRDAAFCEPRFDLLPDSSPPEVPAEALSAGLLRAAVLRDGCLLVRGLVAPTQATALEIDVQRAFEARDAHAAGSPSDTGLYEEFAPEPGFASLAFERAFIASVGIWTADSPTLAMRVFDLLASAGTRELLADYLGEDPVLSINKCTLRRGEPGPPGPWHQDGAFLGDVRTINIWLALTECGDRAPSLDVVPQRIERILETGTEGATHDWSLSPDIAESAGDRGAPVRLRFQPGDALLFDEFFVHRPGSDAAMSETRYALETWVFSPTGFPDAYVPLAF